MNWPEYLKQVREREEKATNGPWHADNDYYVLALADTQEICEGLIYPDTTFIAHSRTDIPLLLKRIEELTEIVQDLLRCQKPMSLLGTMTKARIIINEKVEK